MQIKPHVLPSLPALWELQVVLLLQLMFNLSQTMPFFSDTKQNCHFSVLLEDVANKEGKGNEHDLIQKPCGFPSTLEKAGFLFS